MSLVTNATSPSADAPIRPVGSFAARAQLAGSAISVTVRPSLVAALRAGPMSVPLNRPALGLPMALTPKTMMAGCGPGFTELLIEIAPLEMTKGATRAPLSVGDGTWKAADRRSAAFGR